MLRRLCCVAVVVLLSAVAALAADVSGKWKVTVVTPERSVEGVAAFWQDGKRVTGFIGPSESDPIAITTALDGEHFTIWTHPQPGRRVIFARCDVTVSGDKMTGTTDDKKGTIEFVRVGPVESQPK